MTKLETFLLSLLPTAVGGWVGYLLIKDILDKGIGFGSLTEVMAWFTLLLAVAATLSLLWVQLFFPQVAMAGAASSPVLDAYDDETDDEDMFDESSEAIDVIDDESSAEIDTFDSDEFDSFEDSSAEFMDTDLDSGELSDEFDLFDEDED